MLHVFWRFCNLGWAILWHNRRRTNGLFKELNQVLAPFHFQLNEKTRKRIFFYTAQSAITNHWFCLLRGKNPTASEIENALYLGAFTPIADDLMDSQGLRFEELERSHKTDSADAILFDYLIKKLRPLRQKRSLFESSFKKAHLAQNESLKQLGNKKLPEDELREISFNKGGYYTLLYRFVLDNNPKKGEEDAIYTLGSILQLLNDLFDLHKDYHNGVQTLVTATQDVQFVNEELAKLETKFKIQFTALDYPPKQKRKAYTAIMAIVTRGHVAIEHYQNLQGESAKLNISAYERKPLIVDMEKAGNIWRNLKATKNNIG